MCLCQRLNNQPFIFGISCSVNRVSAVTARPMAGLAEWKTSAVSYNRPLVLRVNSQMLHTAVRVLSVLGENTPFLHHHLLFVPQVILPCSAHRNVFRLLVFECVNDFFTFTAHKVSCWKMFILNCLGYISGNILKTIKSFNALPFNIVKPRNELISATNIKPHFIIVLAWQFSMKVCLSCLPLTRLY